MIRLFFNKRSFFICKNKEHLTIEGIIKLVAIKASINWGLPDKLGAAFSNVLPVKRKINLF